MRLRNRESGQSVVSEAPEGESPSPRRARITMWLYGLFLLSIVGLAIWYAVYTYYHYDGPGQIRVERTMMSPERVGRIQEIYPEEGETVLRGDSLIRVEPGEPCEPVGVTTAEQNRRESRQRAQLLGQRIEDLQQELARKRRELERLRGREILELGNTEPRRNQLEEEIYRLQDEIDQLRLQRQQARETTDQLAGASAAPDPGCKPFVVTAPHNGRVHRIHEKEFTVVDAGTPVLSLTRPSPPVVVLAYLDRDLTGYVQRDDTVRVFLPNGKTTRGVVRETYSTAQEFTQVKYDIYRPYATQLLVEVVPANRAVKEQWQTLDRVKVQVEGQISTQ
ncbi:MAG: HlyD family efflux transporter periplasmic adaptor subunit [Salinibacter sp.]